MPKSEMIFLSLLENPDEREMKRRVVYGLTEHIPFRFAISFSTIISWLNFRCSFHIYFHICNINER